MNHGGNISLPPQGIDQKDLEHNQYLLFSPWKDDYHHTNFYMLIEVPFRSNPLKYYLEFKLERWKHVELFGYSVKTWCPKSNYI